MPALNESSIVIADYPTGLNSVTLDIDPSTYNPFRSPIRGNSLKVLDGTVVHQFFGLQTADFVIQMSGIITSYETLEALWIKYRQGGGGQEFTLTDWYPNKFRVLFSPGLESFLPEYIAGACTAHNYTLNFVVLEVLEWFGASY